MSDTTLQTVVNDAGEAGKITLDAIGIVSGLFPGAASVFNIIKLIADVVSAAPAVYTSLEAASPIITKLANAGLSIMTQVASGKPVDPQALANHVAYMTAAQNALAAGLDIDSPVALAEFPDLAKFTTLSGG